MSESRIILPCLSRAASPLPDAVDNDCGVREALEVKFLDFDECKDAAFSCAGWVLQLTHERCCRPDCRQRFSTIHRSDRPMIEQYDQIVQIHGFVAVNIGDRARLAPTFHEEYKIIDIDAAVDIDIPYRNAVRRQKNTNWSDARISFNRDLSSVIDCTR